MAHIVILGAGTGGMPAAYELRATLDKSHRITVVNAVDYFQFVPSNPWVAVNWRKPDDIKVELAPVFEKKGIGFIQAKVTRFKPAENRVELADGSTEIGFVADTSALDDENLADITAFGGWRAYLAER